MPRLLLLAALFFGAQTLLAQADAAPAASTASTGFLADRIDFAGSDQAPQAWTWPWTPSLACR